MNFAHLPFVAPLGIVLGILILLSTMYVHRRRAQTLAQSLFLVSLATMIAAILIGAGTIVGPVIISEASSVGPGLLYSIQTRPFDALVLFVENSTVIGVPIGGFVVLVGLGERDYLRRRVVRYSLALAITLSVVEFTFLGLSQILGASFVEPDFSAASIARSLTLNVVGGGIGGTMLAFSTRFLEHRLSKEPAFKFGRIGETYLVGFGLLFFTISSVFVGSAAFYFAFAYRFPVQVVLTSDSWTGFLVRLEKGTLNDNRIQLRARTVATRVVTDQNSPAFEMEVCEQIPPSLSCKPTRATFVFGFADRASVTEDLTDLGTKYDETTSSITLDQVTHLIISPVPFSIGIFPRERDDDGMILGWEVSKGTVLSFQRSPSLFYRGQSDRSESERNDVTVRIRNVGLPSKQLTVFVDSLDAKTGFSFRKSGFRGDSEGAFEFSARLANGDIVPLPVQAPRHIERELVQIGYVVTCSPEMSPFQG